MAGVVVAAHRRARLTGVGTASPRVFDEAGWSTTRLSDIPASRWMEFPHVESRTRGFVLLPGESITSPEFVVDADDVVQLAFVRALVPISADGLELQLTLIADEARIPLATFALDNSAVRDVPHIARVELRAFESRCARVELRCSPGPLGDPTADWAGIVALVIASVDQLALATASSQFEWRLANETGHFTGVYDDAIYDGAGRRDDDVHGAAHGAGVRQAPAIARTRSPACTQVDVDAVLARLQDVAPAEGESAHLFAVRMLGGLAPRRLIDFVSRLHALARDGAPLRMLSVCAGAARVEADLLRRARVPIELTLLDLNESLLGEAAARLAPDAKVTTVLGSADDVAALVEGPFDVVCFVSGLHHVVALEDVLGQVRSLLAPRGEFWLIGEQLGRNGNRMWPDARRVAERVFAAWPEDLRRNRNSGALDARPPDFDFGSSGFEGVRSEDLLQAVARHFTVVEETIRNCFLWRLIDLAYIGNFDLARPRDVDVLRRAVAEEFAFYANGGLGCELNGVYRDKLRG